MGETRPETLRPPEASSYDERMPLPEILDELLTSLETGPRITATRHFPARPAVFAPFPSSLDPRIVESLRTRGVTQLYSHQARAFEIAAKGEHLVVVTPTASGCWTSDCSTGRL